MRTGLLHGTLDLLVLVTLARGALHGLGAYQRIEQSIARAIATALHTT